MRCGGLILHHSRQKMPEFYYTNTVYCWFCETGAPVVGSRISRLTWLLLFWLKSNISLIGPAIASNEPWPMRCPPSQLSSMNRKTEDWSVMEWSTKFTRAQGETTSNGWRGP